MNILEKIIEEKQREVLLLKQLNLKESNRATISLFMALQEKTPVGIIAEIKRASPSKGMINERVDPVEQARLYEKNGAAAISVLTDSAFFKGSFEDLEAVRKAVNIPILCKDFIIDPVQIQKAKQAGADAILLIVAALSKEELHRLFDVAKLYGLEALVEVHDEKELAIAMELGAKLIGINNRNLKTFQVDLETTERLAKGGGNHTLISESGIVNSEDVRRVVKAGAKGILVGETLMRADNIEAVFQELSGVGTIV
ncbi:indole-3-glycerol phosphate synthase TrpC [Peribacillus alkalitolerans]|uniref:indole-3-glycerol phosphate synthase TrpC n=1 Tax=Peribacillus alkalitolerans TaxID=1550385 RepID=UPI0013D18488|nr:indole-3-glycerol phosphate synthase TrpC [Peribacillus alkalitolerans]